MPLVLSTSPLSGMPKAHENDKASFITKSRVCQVHMEDEVMEKVAVSFVMQIIRSKRILQTLIWLWRDQLQLRDTTRLVR